MSVGDFRASAGFGEHIEMIQFFLDVDMGMEQWIADTFRTSPGW